MKPYFRLLPAVLALFISSLISAQTSSLLNFGFSDEKIEIPEQFKNQNEVILLKNLKTEILANERSAEQYFLIHEKKWINSDEGVERNNRVYIPFKSDETLLLNKVRVISENGKITELNPKDIMEETDEETDMKYNYYAVNGLTKGAIIEKIFLIKESPDLEGKIIKIQEEQPILNATFELIYPKYLVFRHKSYNGLAEAIENSEENDNSSSLLISQKNIEGILDDETYSNWDRHIMKFKYKLDQNQASGKSNLYNYLDFAKNVYDNVHIELDKKDQKAIDAFVKDIPKSKNQFEQLKFIENKVKNSISFNRYFNGNNSLSDVIRNKQANGLFLLRFYTAIFNQLGIESEMVFTSKRYSVFFDKDFETMEQLVDVIFYFPNVNEYMDFLSLEYRLPMVNFNYTGNYGLFVKGKELGGAKIGLGTVKLIEIPSAESNHDIQNILIDFTKNIEKPEIHATYTFNGYSALNFQPLKDFVPQNQYDMILKDFAQNYTLETDYKSLKTENDGLENVGFKPFVLDAKFDGTIQKAGNNILFKAGETIGKQMELYQDHQRLLPVEVYYPRKYTRTLTIKIPDGYSIKNPESFNFDKKLVLNGKTEAAFVSSYVQKGSELIVTNEEFYNILEYPLEVFEKYREVINAAADFNKITLVLSKD